MFALYVAGYPVGRVVIELMRTDDANHILGLRVNVWVSLLVFLLGVALFVWFGRRPEPRRPAERRSDPDGARAARGRTPRVPASGMSRIGM